jgi:tellurite resistance protein TehA-like permease
VTARTPLSRGRIAAAIVVAIAADAFSFVIGPFGFTFADEIVDVAVMGIETWLLGFHLLFLPTFVVEVIPLVDAAPTWTMCVLAVVAIRRRGSFNQ